MCAHTFDCPTQAVSHAHPRYLAANALALVQVVVLGAVMGGWAAQGQSTVQLGLALGVKALYAQ